MGSNTYNYNKIGRVQTLIDGGMLMTRAAAEAGISEDTVIRWRKAGLITVPNRPLITPPPRTIGPLLGYGGWWCGCGFRGVTSVDLRNHRQQCRG